MKDKELEFEGKPVKDWENVPMQGHDDGLGKRKPSTPNDK